MEKFLDLYGFLAVLLRGGALVFQALTLGGLVFLWLVLRRGRSREADEPAARVARKLLFAAAMALVLLQAATVSLSVVVLTATTGMPLG